MRLVFAIVAFCLAAVFLGAGVAQRTVLLAPDRIVESISFDSETVYTVISPNALTVNGQNQIVTATGDGELFVAYGRVEDVLAWVGAAEYTLVGWSDEELELRSQKMTPKPEESFADAPLTGSPAGSDLWLQEYTSTDTVSAPLALPDGYAAIVASNGIDPAPGDIQITWPLDNSTPLAGPLFTLGALFFGLGGFLMWQHWRHDSRGGPRRKGRPQAEIDKPKRFALPDRNRPSRKELGPRSRRSLTRLSLATILGASMLGLTGCSAGYWPQAPQPSATVSEEDAAAAELDTQPAVSVPQMERILSEISSFAAAADGALDANALPTRFAGPALEARKSNYAVRAAKADYPAPAAIPARPLTITLPQQIDASWPRVVMTVSQNAEDETIAPVALVMLQQTPRSNYQIYYALSLVPNAQSPELAPASVGAPLLPPDSKLLELPPNEIAAAYADVLNQDSASAYATIFDPAGDSLREQLGKAGQDAIRAGLPANSAIEFSASPGTGPVITLATNDSGGIVSVQVVQNRKITPTDGGLVGFAEGSASAALSGFTSKSARGVQSQTSLQILFYVPAVGSSEPIRMLGWTESLISASEIPG